MRDLSLEIIEIEADKNLPDCCFIEDTAIIHNNKALLTRSRMKSRRDEITEVKTVLKEFFQVTSVTDPGTIEGGDVVHIHDQLISGLSHGPAQWHISRFPSSFSLECSLHSIFREKDPLPCWLERPV